jgi:hypothetical protein
LDIEDQIRQALAMITMGIVALAVAIILLYPFVLLEERVLK